MTNRGVLSKPFVCGLSFPVRYGDVKVSTGDATPDKRAAVRDRHKIRKLKITDKRTVSLAAWCGPSLRGAPRPRKGRRLGVKVNRAALRALSSFWSYRTREPVVGRAGKGTLKQRLRSEKITANIFRTRVQLPPSPPETPHWREAQRIENREKRIVYNRCTFEAFLVYYSLFVIHYSLFIK